MESRERWVGNGREWWCLGGVLGGGGWVVGVCMYVYMERVDVMAWTNERNSIKRKAISSQEYIDVVMVQTVGV